MASTVTPICVNDAALADDDAADLRIGDVFEGEGGAEFVITTGKHCTFGCVDGFDMNCDGRLGDFCPTGLDRRTVAGAKTCLAGLDRNGSSAVSDA